MMRNTGHIEGALLRAVAASAKIEDHAGEKPMMIVEAVHSVDWASATFIGARLAIDLRFEGSAAAVTAAVARLGDSLPDCDIPITGHIIADIAVEQGASQDMPDNMIAKTLTVNALIVVD